MAKEKQKGMSARVAQNIVPIGLIFIEAVLVFSEAAWNLPLAVNLLILAGAALSGLFFILEREKKDGRIKGPHISSVLSFVCWAWFAVAMLLEQVNPGIYGVDLGALGPLLVNIGGSAVLAAIFTITALVVTAKRWPS
jgi:hypothetical protein